MRYIHLLRRPEILFLWLGQLASTAGNRLFAMALLWLTLELTGSTQQMALVSLFETVPYLLVGLVGGTLIDRSDRINLMIWLDLVRAFIVLLIPVAHLAGGLQPLHLALVAMALGGLEALFGPALESTLPGMAAPAELPALSGLVDTTTRFARILGPGMAGLLLTFMPPVHFFTLDGGSFIISALCLALVARRAPRPQRPAAATRKARPRSLLTDLTVGWRIIFREPTLLIPLLVDSLNNLAWAAFTLGAPVLAATRLQGSMGSYGLLIGAYGVGSLAGNLLVGNTGRIDRLMHGRLGGWGVVGLGFMLLGLAPTLPLALAATALAGVGGAISHVSRSASISVQVEGEHLGKVFSLQKMWSQGASGLGLGAAGWAISLLDAPVAILGAGLFMGLTGLAGLILLGKWDMLVRLRTARRTIS